MLQLGAHRRSRSFTKRAASAKTSPPRPAPQPDIMTPTSVRPMRRCMTYSSAGSWSRVTQWMHSTGHVSMDSCAPRARFRVGHKTPTSVRRMRRCMTYSSAGSWSGRHPVDAPDRARVNGLLRSKRSGLGLGTLPRTWPGGAPAVRESRAALSWCPASPHFRFRVWAFSTHVTPPASHGRGAGRPHLDLGLRVHPLRKHAAAPVLGLHPEGRRRAPDALLAADAADLVHKHGAALGRVGRPPEHVADQPLAQRLACPGRSASRLFALQRRVRGVTRA